MNITALLLTWLIVGVQGPAREQSEIAVLRGVVTRMGIGDALNKAQVRLIPSSNQGIQQRTTTTDSVGRFVLAAVSPGKYRLLVTRNGYVRQEYEANRPGGRGKDLELAAGEDKELLIRLLPAPTLSGRVKEAIHP